MSAPSDPRQTIALAIIAALTFGWTCGYCVGLRMQDRSEIVAVRETARQCMVENVKLLHRAELLQVVANHSPVLTPVRDPCVPRRGRVCP